ncbi:hypothetical protein LTR91_023740 [Friedmanniomyces endolithicus]|uniref:Uncharacterized protein n=2 Tax=Dothideomycetidae TaxID=451867 RepID=A0AAN6FHG2_9PEZI|nr:hypothetical protein LTS09_005523 [Friedmanniomyces endolithicus]KAK5144947.1 hypothetical protein LTR32_003210 [Rachicladosporium monterosium]KAK0282099.1 hypothetical protein LTR35_007197 [Friedmanniomyces endolithicus]KAK0290085.1 hypothetical protein LTS00_008916 [Friedmanniomyces endolithicus]KAK0318482.1 hypothetical protein LTR82_010544 [Friedmanniomyces endolithicus]
MSGTSNVGGAGVYEAGDQRTRKDADIEAEKKEARFHEGKDNSHKANDAKDERSIANKLERESKRENESEKEDIEAIQYKQDATLPARSHGNEPSKGAKIDQELREEEEAILAKKGSFGPKQ